MIGSAQTIARVVLALSVALSCAAQTPTSASAPAKPSDSDEDRALRAFAAIHPIDVHVHVFKTDPVFQKMLEQLNAKLLNILVMDDTLPYRKQLQPQIDDAQALVRSSRGHIALCTTFDPYKFDSASFSVDAIKQIDRDFAQGAIAVKIWKNIGMEIKDSSGQYIMADDPKFEPIYQENPQWYVANRPGFPPKQKILEARDHVLANNPKLRMVGVHLGSMERDLDNIARHLDKYPNFAIDTAARMEYLMLMPPEKVSAFLIKYQDRVLYGTDLDLDADANLPDALTEWQSTYARDWKFLATGETLVAEGKQVRGLNLPQPVLQKIFRTKCCPLDSGIVKPVQ